MTILDDLLAAYRAAPTAELHDLIVRASSELVPAVPAELRGRLKPAQTAWTALAKQPSSRDVPALLETLADAGSRVAVPRMTTVNKWPADPRIDEQIVRWIVAPPWEGDIAKPFWRLVVERMAKIRDVRIAQKLADRDFGGRGLDGMMQIWVFNHRERAAKTIAAQPYPPTTNATEVARLAASVDAAISAAQQATPTSARAKEELLAEIFERPDETAPRLVYADVLTSQGDPRGEFIAIQCAPQSDAKAAKRASQLLKKHGAEWLGPLARVVMKHYVFERGFLARCQISDQKRASVPPLVGNPAWSTVCALGGSVAIALDPIMVSLRELAFWGPEQRDAWRNLLVEVPRPIEHLAFSPSNGYRSGMAAEELAALGACDALPALRSLTVACTTDEFLALLRSSVAKRLHGIGAATPGTGYVYGGERWVAELIEACEVPVLELQSQVRLRVERTGDVTFTLGESRQQVEVALAMIPHLPSVTKRVTIRAPEAVGMTERETIANGVRARFGDIVAPSIVLPAELPNQVGVVI